MGSDNKGNGASGQETQNNPSGTIAAPSITLPKGGGAIRGMEEKFAANPVTGTGSMSVPIATSPGRSGFGPRLSLSYDSGAGNGPFGFGWSLSLPAITRKTDKGLPKYQDAGESDVFILSGAEDLVPVLVEIGGQWQRETLPPRTVDGKVYRIQRYRPRIEGLFARIERWTNQADPQDTFWRSISKDNITTLYGKTAESRIADPADPTRIFSWLICQSYDDKGNAIVYNYAAENDNGVDLSLVNERNRVRGANRYLKRIRYGNRQPNRDLNWQVTDPATLPDHTWMFEVVFDYGEHDAETPLPQELGKKWSRRNDPFSSYRSGFEVRSYRLCQRVLMFHHFPNENAVGENCLVRSTDFLYSYEKEPNDPRNPLFSFLISVSHSGYKRQGDGSYLKKSLPPLEFEYTQPVVSTEIHELAPESLKNLPYGLDGIRYQWIDLDGEGLSGILTEQGGGWFYKRNLSPVNVQQENGQEAVTAHFGPVELVMEKPSLAALGSGRQQFLDLAGDGQLDLVELEGPAPGFYERTPDEGWEAFTSFRSLPVLDWGNPNLKFVDLTGDGHADILISEDEVFCWHPSLAEAGFGPSERICKALDEEKGPRLVFADSTQSIYLADLSGDGLTDLLRIRNGEVCYWPNLGYGRFGAKVAMDNAPWFDRPDQFNQQRVRLADIDGSGVTDIIYLGRDGVRLYFNQSGNSWSEPRRLSQFPHTDNLSSVMTVDLLGNGTACLVWSSPLPGDAHRPMRYVDLMGGQKPHLLIKTVNNLGAETHIHYAPSTKFYLTDKLAGKPWITKLPFPVHVVERVETYDRISRNRFVSCYAYHHGYFDGSEREFRGFGLVEQWDTEEFAALNTSQQFPVGANVEESSHVPPALTRTWFHTGVYVGRGHVSDFFAGLVDENDLGEYYREPGLTDEQARQLLLADTELPAGLTVEEEREACRALKGSMLRQEVYALDGSPEEKHPYTVTEQNFTIKRLQSQAENRYAVFFTHARESASYHYERNPADPRISHALTLEVDEFGNVLKSAAIGYGRRQPDLALSAEDRAKQTQTLITYTENRVTNTIEATDDYRTPLPCESRTYELTGLVLPVGRSRFSLAEVLTVGTGAVPIAYEQNPLAGVLQKRLIEHVRTLYRRNDLTGTLPLGALQSLALPLESYKLAFTLGLLANVYGGRVTNAVLETEGRYVHSEGDANWWTPSGQMFYSPGSNDPAAQELAYARAHFFLPHRYRDPFDNRVTVAYDSDDINPAKNYNLLIVQTHDPLGNTARAEHDYRVLQPTLVTDPNGAISEARFDALGLLVGTAVHKGNQGDSFQNFQIDLTQAQVDAFFAAPKDPGTIALLGSATTRVIYDLGVFSETQTAHPNDPDRWQPVYAATLARETHVSDPVPPGGLKIQVSFSYSDGFSREIQKKIQAGPGPVPKRDPATGKIITVNGQPEMTPNDVSPRWVGSGWTVFNNKGKPVRQYEPFFADTHRFEFDVRIGVSPVLFYDPVERVVATLHPNRTWEKIVFDPWRQKTYDVNDTVLVAGPETDADVGDFFRRLPNTEYLPTWHVQRQGGALGPQEQAAATKAAVHADTPTLAHFDTLGRTFLTVADNGGTEKYATRVKLDIEGNQREVIDAKDRIVMRSDYDMLGNRIHQASMEAGERWMLNDVTGKPIRVWDSRGHGFRTAYDQLRRPTESYMREGVGPELLVGRTVYGETRPNPEANNLRRKVVQLFDQAGVVTSDDYDFKGNLLRSQCQLAREYKTTLNWSAAVLLEAPPYVSRTTYDALNRPVTLTTPDNSVIRPGYNDANLLERIDANLRGAAVATTFVTDIDYNAKGQRTLIDYGNGVRTTYEYDKDTFRLTHIKTLRGGTALQDLRYTYDPAGNITHIRDDAQQTIYFNNAVVQPHADYTYDAIYRLTKAEGREHRGQVGQPQHTTWSDEFRINLPHPHNGQAMRRYTEQYQYDEVGNILNLIHQAQNGNWTRGYTYNEASLLEPAKKSNRLSGTTVGATTEAYTHDAHGNMTSMPHLTAMEWDFNDQLQQVDLGGGGTACYVYDAAGQRVRKVIERQNGTRQKERIYVGGFELYREFGGNGATVALERETLHIMDGQQRIALVETKTIDNQSPILNSQPLIRYQCGSHLGSTALELDDQAQVISYEEYHPYGSTAYQAVRNQTETPKRYRYTGKERDEETALYYHGARYYAAWLGRWVSCDPAGMIDGTDLYVYCRNIPISHHDPRGTEDTKMSEPSVLNTVDQTLERKGIAYNTEVTVRVELPDGTTVERRYDRMFQDPKTQEWVAIEAKGTRPSQLTEAEILADKIVQEKGGRFEIIESARKPPSSSKVQGIAFTEGFKGEIRPGNLHYMHGNPSYASGIADPHQLNVSAWKVGMDWQYADVPRPTDVNGNPMVRKVRPNQAPEWITQEQVKLERAKNVGNIGAKLEQAKMRSLKRQSSGGSVDPKMFKTMGKAVKVVGGAAEVVAPLAVQPTPEKTHEELLTMAIGAAVAMAVKANPVLGAFAITALGGAHTSAVASKNMNTVMNEAVQNADPSREGPYQRVPAKKFMDLFSW
ncbi:MAG TPA: SpvB/TcaC N-terminal domain-containing protein [Candidatus Binatia bacterium]|jgi:RHS repeat-associated protein|nr:SpvB/TcaC N-terminal domain-containing protein [Candidatus Binatia bacterium]